MKTDQIADPEDSKGEVIMKSEKAILNKKILEDRIRELRYKVTDNLSNPYLGYSEGEKEVIETNLTQVLNFLQKKCRNTGQIDLVLDDIKLGMKYPDISKLEFCENIISMITTANDMLNYASIEDGASEYGTEDMILYKEAKEKESGGYHKDMRRFEAHPLSEGSGGKAVR